MRWRALYLISKGVVAADAARRTGRASSWITNLARRYNHDDAETVSRKQSTRPSHRAKMNQPLGKELEKALRSEAPDGGLWTAPKVAAWITEKTGHEVHQTTAWRAMRRLGREPSSASSGKQAAGINGRANRVQKKIELEAQALHKAYPSDDVEVWSQDARSLRSQARAPPRVVADGRATHGSSRCALRMGLALCGNSSSNGARLLAHLAATGWRLCATLS